MRGVLACLALVTVPASAEAQQVTRLPAFAAIAPESRTSYAGGPSVTYFLSLINSSQQQLTNCQPYAPSFPPNLSYQTVTAQNQLTGTPNTPAMLGPGATQGFLLTLPPVQIFEQGMTPEFQCDQGRSTRTPALSGGFTVAQTPLPDIIAISATPTNDGVARAATPGATTFMAVAGVNIGAAGQVDVIAEDSPFMAVPAILTVCETNPATAACLAPPAASVRVDFAANQTRTFSVFAQTPVGGGIPFWPDAQRIRLNFKHVAGGWTVGGTSAAITSPAPANAAFGPSLWVLRLDNDILSSQGLMAQWGDGRAMLWGAGGIGVWDVTGNEFLWSVRQGSVSGGQWNGQPGNVMIANRPDTIASGSAQIEPRLSMIGTFGPGANGATGTMRAVFDSVATDYPVSAAQLAGNYDVLNGILGATDIGDATINANGTWSGQYSVAGSTNCLWSGQFSQEAGRNFFTIRQEFQGVLVNCPSTINLRNFAGFATQIATLGNGGAVIAGFVAQETVDPINPLTFTLRRK